MSDNPADSLRRELEAAIDGARLHVFWPTSMPKAAVDATWPLITAALEAARADERERNAQAIEAALGVEDYRCNHRIYGACRECQANAVLPIVSAAVAAAEKQMAERIAKACLYRRDLTSTPMMALVWEDAARVAREVARGMAGDDR